MKKLVVISLCLAILLAVGCSSIPAHITNQECLDNLSTESIEILEELIPALNDWYPTVDISKQITTSDFMPQRITSLLNELVNQNDFSANYNYFKPLAYIAIKTSSMVIEAEGTTSIDLNSSEVSTSEFYVKFNKEEWKKIGDAIQEAVDYYYD